MGKRGKRRKRRKNLECSTTFSENPKNQKSRKNPGATQKNLEMAQIYPMIVTARFRFSSKINRAKRKNEKIRTRLAVMTT